MLAADVGSGDVLVTLLWFTMLVIWVYLLIIVATDLFRSRDLSGVAKFLWLLFIVVLPYVGIFAYLIVRGHEMHDHAVADAQAADHAAQAYIRQAAAGAGVGIAGELERLADLRDSGAITGAEFQKRKAQLLER
ncbi:MAG TPA: SHOCT domain-containing protein [Acidimicrobiales bacterium]|nr:SHOCT domain-containing protein [Acidimicrobiales bacterium]